MVTNARNLHEFLGSKDRFADWIKRRIEQYGFVENVDYQAFSESTEKVAHVLSTALVPIWRKELSMVERTERGKRSSSVLYRLRRTPAPCSAKGT